MAILSGTTLRETMTPPNSKTKWSLLIRVLPMLQGYVRRLADNDEQAKEIMQEVSVRMLATEGPGDPERYAAWARGVVRHVIAHDWRKRRRARAEQPFEEDLVEEFVEPPTDPEAHLDARAWVERIVGDLDSEGLELLYRRYVLQESGRELADELDRSPAAVRMRLMRLRSSASALARTARDALALAAPLAGVVFDYPIG
jgi:RNA polymerase sigma factor (sigma-70 family)